MNTADEDEDDGDDDEHDDDDEDEHDDDDDANGIDDIELREEYTQGPDFRAINATILKDPSYEALELSESTVKALGGGKAGPQGK